MAVSIAQMCLYISLNDSYVQEQVESLQAELQALRESADEYAAASQAEIRDLREKLAEAAGAAGAADAAAGEEPTVGALREEVAALEASKAALQVLAFLIAFENLS